MPAAARPAVPALTVHGVLLQVCGTGVLLTGASGVGKSELALELLSRGHRLVADDAPLLERREGRLWGRCPELLEGFLEVRGLGVLSVRALLGEGAVLAEVPVELVVHLEPADAAAMARLPRLHPVRDEVELLGVILPRLHLPVAPGRNLAVLVETAVRLHALAVGGYDAAADLTARQRRAMEGGGGR